MFNFFRHGYGIKPANLRTRPNLCNLFALTENSLRTLKVKKETGRDGFHYAYFLLREVLMHYKSREPHPNPLLGSNGKGVHRFFTVSKNVVIGELHLLKTPKTRLLL